MPFIARYRNIDKIAYYDLGFLLEVSNEEVRPTIDAKKKSESNWVFVASAKKPELKSDIEPLNLIVKGEESYFTKDERFMRGWELFKVHPDPWLPGAKFARNFLGRPKLDNPNKRLKRYTFHASDAFLKLLEPFLANRTGTQSQVLHSLFQRGVELGGDYFVPDSLKGRKKRDFHLRLTEEESRVIEEKIRLSGESTLHLTARLIYTGLMNTEPPKVKEAELVHSN